MHRPLAGWVAALALFVACSGNDPLAGPPELEVSPLAFDFGVSPLNTPTAMDLTLRNLGGGEISLLSVTLTEGDPDVWRTQRTGANVVGPGGAEVVQVLFLPENSQRYTGLLQVRTDVDSATISLSGEGGLPGGDEDGDGFSPAQGDCDDENPAVFPGAEEVCDGVDNDCNGILLVDEVDDDEDGWPVCAGDCNDDNDTIYPGAEEICDDLDNDCDNVTPDRLDRDGDGFTLCGDENDEGPGDCDDLNAVAFPGNPELCDTFDNDCDGEVDNLDEDGDGRSVCLGVGDCNDADPTAYAVIVSENGDDEGLGTDVDPYATLATALANLDATCRTIVLEPGTYTEGEQLVVDGQTVTVVSRTEDRDDVVIEAPKESRHFDVVNGGGLTVAHLQLTGGNAADNGGSIRVTGGDLTLDDVLVSNNTSDADGGALAITSGSLTLRGGVELSDNDAGADGGAVLLDQSTLSDTEGTRYASNTAAIGGALRIEGGTATLRGATLDGNAATEGGAISAVGAGTFVFERNLMQLNAATEGGGGIALRDVDHAAGYLRNNRIQDNAGASGGGVAVLGAVGALQLHNNTLTGNEATAGEGAGLWVSATDATGLDVVSQVLHSNDGNSAVFVAAGSGASVTYTTVFGTNSGNHFAGEVGDGAGGPLEVTNQVRNPELVAFSDDGDPSNDDLDLQAASPEVDDGPDNAAFNDVDNTRNDRGFTGGPAAQP